MADFNVRADAVDVEQIMRQIRGRIRDKRGVDYTEDQIQELAKVKLEKFLDPRGIRSDLLEQFRSRPSDVPPTYPFDDQTLFASSKPLLRFIRKLLRPVLKLLFNANALKHVLHTQVGINEFLMARAARDVLVYEVMHNLVVEVTRASIEVKNMKMRVESIASRLEFNERRARALEAVVQYRPDAERGRDHDRDRDHDQPRRGGESRPQTSPTPLPGPGPVDPITGGDSLRSRRKRRRRGRRSGPGFGETFQGPGAGVQGEGSGDRPSDFSLQSSGESLEPESDLPGAGSPEPEARSHEPAASPEPRAESREPEAQ